MLQFDAAPDSLSLAYENFSAAAARVLNKAARDKRHEAKTILMTVIRSVDMLSGPKAFEPILWLKCRLPNDNACLVDF